MNSDNGRHDYEYFALFFPISHVDDDDDNNIFRQKLIMTLFAVVVAFSQLFSKRDEGNKNWNLCTRDTSAENIGKLREQAQ